MLRSSPFPPGEIFPSATARIANDGNAKDAALACLSVCLCDAPMGVSAVGEKKKTLISKNQSMLYTASLPPFPQNDDAAVTDFLCVSLSLFLIFQFVSRVNELRVFFLHSARYTVVVLVPFNFSWSYQSPYFSLRTKRYFVLFAEHPLQPFSSSTTNNTGKQTLLLSPRRVIHTRWREGFFLTKTT